MEIITEFAEVEVISKVIPEKTIYIAPDGEEFDYESSCLWHEFYLAGGTRKYFKNIENRFRPMRATKYTANTDEQSEIISKLFGRELKGEIVHWSWHDIRKEEEFFGTQEEYDNYMRELAKRIINKYAY